jgi:hypothetical protein
MGLSQKLTFTIIMKRRSAAVISPPDPPAPAKKKPSKAKKETHGRDEMIREDGYAIDSDTYGKGSSSSPSVNVRSRKKSTKPGVSIYHQLRVSMTDEYQGGRRLRTRYLTVTRNRKTKIRQLHKLPRNVAPSLFHLLSHLLLPKRNPQKKGNQ